MVLLGVRIAPEKLVGHPHRDNIGYLHQERVNHMKLFIEKAYAKRDRRMTSSMQVLIDCSWMVTEHVPMQVTHITEFLENMCPLQQNPRNLDVMLDFGLRSFGIRVYFKRGGYPRSNEISAKMRNVGPRKYTLVSTNDIYSC